MATGSAATAPGGRICTPNNTSHMSQANMRCDLITMGDILSFLSAPFAPEELFRREDTVAIIRCGFSGRIYYDRESATTGCVCHGPARDVRRPAWPDGRDSLDQHGPFEIQRYSPDGDHGDADAQGAWRRRADRGNGRLSDRVRRLDDRGPP